MRQSGKGTFALVALFVGLPLLPVGLWAIARQWFYPALLPQSYGLRGFRDLLGGGLGAAAWDSVLVAFAATGLCLLLAWPAARALGQVAFRGKGAIRLLVLAPALLPSMATALGLHTRFIHLGLADTTVGVVIAHLLPALPYAVSALAASFSALDPRFEEASRNLGAGQLRTLASVTLPLIAPGLVVAGLFAFIISWSQYTLTLVVGGGVVITLPVLLYSLASGGDLHLTAAACVALLLPVLAVLPFTAKSLSGTQLGGR